MTLRGGTIGPIRAAIHDPFTRNTMTNEEEQKTPTATGIDGSVLHPEEISEPALEAPSATGHPGEDIHPPSGRAGTPAETYVPDGDGSTGEARTRSAEGNQAESLPPDLASLVEDMETYDLAVEVEALERETNRLENIVIPSFEQHAARVGQLDQEVDALFAVAYEDPASARVRFDQTAIRQGPEAAATTIREVPTEYGTLKGGRFRPRQNQQVRAALAALEHRAATYHRTLVVRPDAVDRNDLPMPSGPAEKHTGGREGQPESTDSEPLEETSRATSRAGVREEPSGLKNAPTGAAASSQVPQSRVEADDGYREAKDAFDRRLEQLYEHPAAARTRFEAIEQRLGTDRAAFGLAQSPEGLGALRPEVSRSHVVRAEYTRAAALAASDPRRLGDRHGVHTPSHDAALRAAHDRLRILRTQASELKRRIHERTSTSDAMRGRSRGQMRQSLEDGLRRLGVEERRRVVDAFADRLASRGRTASLERRGHGGLHRPHREATTMGRNTAGAGTAVRRFGVGSAALSIAMHLAERALRRGAEEITGRETFSR